MVALTRKQKRGRTRVLGHHCLPGSYYVCRSTHQRRSSREHSRSPWASSRSLRHGLGRSKRHRRIRQGWRIAGTWVPPRHGMRGTTRSRRPTMDSTESSETGHGTRPSGEGRGVPLSSGFFTFFLRRALGRCPGEQPPRGRMGIGNVSYWDMWELSGTDLR